MNGGPGLRSLAWLRHVILAAVLGTIALLALVSLVHRDQRALLGEEIVYDEFGFSAVDVRRAAEVGPPSERVTARGSFVIVRLRVANHAKSVDYALSQHTPVLEDAGGRRFELDARATAALARESRARARPATIRAGEEYVAEIVFDLPETASDLRLRITWGAPVTPLDRLVCGDRTIALSP